MFVDQSGCGFFFPLMTVKRSQSGLNFQHQHRENKHLQNAPHPERTEPGGDPDDASLCRDNGEHFGCLARTFRRGLCSKESPRREQKRAPRTARINGMDQVKHLPPRGKTNALILGEGGQRGGRAAGWVWGWSTWPKTRTATRPSRRHDHNNNINDNPGLNLETE